MQYAIKIVGDEQVIRVRKKYADTLKALLKRYGMSDEAAEAEVEKSIDAYIKNYLSTLKHAKH